MKRLLLGVALIALATACATAPEGAPAADLSANAEEAAETPATEAAPDKYPTPEGLVLSAPDTWGDWGIDTTAFKASVRPGDDFNTYVNGTWIDTIQIPADRSRYGNFDLLREKSEQRVRLIIEDLAREEPAIETAEGKIGAYYAAYLDMDTINAAGLAPAEPYFNQIDAAAGIDDIARLTATVGFASPFSGFVFVDDKDPETYIFQMGLAGLGLPDRDYYLKDDAKSVEHRAKYVELLTTLLGKAGYADPAAAAAGVMAFETEMARAHWDLALSRNPEITYNKLSREEFDVLAGEFPASLALETLGVGDETHFLVAQIPPTTEELAAAGISDEDAMKLGGGFPAMFQIASETPLDTWKAYLKAHFLIDHSDVLPDEIDREVFAFYGTTLRGQPQQRERWKRAVSSTENVLGEAIGQVFVERYFPPENKAAMDDLVANLRKAMAANLEELTWMSDTTKVKAEEKLDSFNPKIGYPEKFETYDTLVVGPNALENSMAAAKWALEDNLSDLGSTVDKSKWFMTPQTVNAYYNPSFNEIVFPAAILQPPFFNLSADPAVNYGAIGGVIGHEMGHGFDDQGAKSNATGALSNWWTAEDQAAFRELGDALVAQYNSYCPLDDGTTCINGRLTLGENIGDLGGLSMAYRAYQLSLDTNGDGAISETEQAPVIDGLTGDQRFFLGWAQVWRANYRDEAQRQQILTDPHSPSSYRVNGVVRNLDAWYSAFGVTEDDALYLPPEDRVRIW
ncbi:peptidase, M13 family [Hyphomonas neptunium ATCC 15444]|uniref:Peptidase, M13 family n=2 Tax=Hyphomonas TaxID=85 RepID=Q0BXQ5_HYPNA|nr:MULTISPECIES: M13 family metallopeptidase [Hyphomonas]ABI77470.1 peptidase, M13 family [Hyphomonas neptunium ATCC 15444]KCZ93572.1 M13 family peptidase [Hyphomonas hirschiana VP5]